MELTLNSVHFVISPPLTQFVYEWLDSAAYLPFLFLCCLSLCLTLYSGWILYSDLPWPQTAHFLNFCSYIYIGWPSQLLCLPISCVCTYIAGLSWLKAAVTEDKLWLGSYVEKVWLSLSCRESLLRCTYVMQWTLNSAHFVISVLCVRNRCQSR